MQQLLPTTPVLRCVQVRPWLTCAAYAQRRQWFWVCQATRAVSQRCVRQCMLNGSATTLLHLPPPHDAGALQSSGGHVAGARLGCFLVCSFSSARLRVVVLDPFLFR